MAYSKFYVTFSEMALLQILWDASRPLNRQEIMAKAYENPEEPLFARTSFHLLANEPHKKGLLVPVDNMGIGRKNARRYAPTLSRNEFLALQVSSTENYSPQDMPEIFAALMDYSKDADVGAILTGMEQLIQKKREQLAKKEPFPNDD